MNKCPADKGNLTQIEACNVMFSSLKVFKAHYVDGAQMKKLVGMMQ